MRFIGCKTNLLDEINVVINSNCKNSKTFCDLFSGTGTVGLFFKKNYEIISNDLLYFSYILQKGSISINNQITFKKLYSNLEIDCDNSDLIDNVIEYLNNINFKEYDGKKTITNNYSPKGGRMYLTEENALKIDCIRNLIEIWKENSVISEDEYYYLLSCLINAIPSYSNISGTYGAYLKSWDKRALKEFKLEKKDIIINTKINKSYNLNGIELLEKISGDILYLDPPYNSRQYLPNYHLLETVAKYDEPVTTGVTGVRNYDKEKSNWCSKIKVYDEFETTLKKAKFKHIILSYSSDGIMEEDKIVDIMRKYAENSEVKLKKVEYRRFRSRSVNEKRPVYEFIFYIKKKEIYE